MTRVELAVAGGEGVDADTPGGVPVDWIAGITAKLAPPIGNPSVLVPWTILLSLPRLPLPPALSLLITNCGAAATMLMLNAMLTTDLSCKDFFYHK